MDIITVVFGSLVSSAAFAAVVTIIFKESFTKLLDKRLEHLKHQLGISAKTHELALSSEIAFREKQLSEFYGPIYTILKRNDTIHYHWCDDRLVAVESNVRDLFLSSNIEISGIILSKSYLIEGDGIPKSYIDFLTHVFVWKAFSESSLERFPFDKYEFQSAFFQEAFPNEIFQTTEMLKRRLYDLRARGIKAAEQGAAANP